MGYSKDTDINLNLPKIRCPYMVKHSLDEINCYGGSRIRFTVIADGRRWKHQYCCGEWETCTISQACRSFESPKEDETQD